MIVDIASWLKDAAERRLSAGDIGEGLRYYERLVHLGRADKVQVAHARARTGEVLLAMGEIQQAKVHLLEALKNRPTHPHYLFLLSCLYASTANWKKACEFARKAHILAPNNSEYLRALGWAVLCSGNLNAGEKMLRQAVSLEPKNLGAIGDLSAALIEQRRFNEAIEILARAVKDNPSEKRLTDMLAVATKFRNQARDRTLMFAPRLTGQYGVVEDLLRERMPEEGFHSEQIDSAIRLWRDFTCGTELRFSSPGSWAAAVEYTISKLDRDARVTQKFVATKYGVSVSAVSTKFKRIWHGLGVKDFDVRYSSHKDYFEKLFQERDSTDKE